MENPGAPSRSLDAARLHLDCLDGLRAVAALFVVFHHALLQVDPGSKTLGAWRVGGFVSILTYGRFAVDLFIVLSGFCLMLPVTSRDGKMRYSAAEFFRRRAWRILPPYYLAMLFSLTWIWLAIGKKTGTHWDNSLPVSAKSILSHLVLLHDAVGESSTINHVFWSVAVEWRIYFLFPLLVWLWRRFGPHISVAAVVISSFILMRLCENFIHATLTINYLGLFAMGMWSASISHSAPRSHQRIKKLPWGMITAVLGVAAALGVYHIPLPTKVERQAGDDYLAGLAFAALLMLVSMNATHPLRQLLSCKPLVWIGAFAYSIYLIHAPLLQVLWQAMPALQSQPRLMLAALSLVGVPMIVGISYLFFLICERPFLRYKIRLPRSIVAKTVEEPAP